MAVRSEPGLTIAIPGEITPGSEVQRGFINDNVLHTPEYGDVHYSSYIPESYDGSKPYALFVTLPGWEGLYFQGIGANMIEDFGVEAIQYDDEMIVLSTQLNDWGEASANQAIALTEYFLAHYNIAPEKVYLHGYSGGGETGSLVMEKKPELFTAFLCCATQWDGDMTALVNARTPVYMVTGENDSYYGSKPLKDAYEKLRNLYLAEGLTESEISELVILEIKEKKYFTDRGYADQHMGGQAFAKDESIMGWLFGEH